MVSVANGLRFLCHARDPRGPPSARRKRHVARESGAMREYNYVWNNQGRCFELPCFGDVNYVESALKVSFPQTAGPLESGDAANLPVRDLRLRYVSHDILHDAAPGLASAHGLPTRGPSRATLCVMLKDEQYDFFTKLCYQIFKGWKNNMLVSFLQRKWDCRIVNVL